MATIGAIILDELEIVNDNRLFVNPQSEAYASRFRLVKNDMEKLNVFAFYNIGAMVTRYHQRLIKEKAAMDQLIILTLLKSWFEIFLRRSSDTSWRATRDRAKQMMTLLDEQVAEDVLPKTGPIPPVPSDYIDRVTKLLQAFEATFASETENSNVFSVSRKGTHDSMALMEIAGDNLPPETRARLSDETIRDIQDAGKCLALDCHTASGYHILRGVERVIIKYLERVSGKPINPKNRNWGVYIRDLTRLGADKSVIGYIDHMRVFYRNPIIHPEQSLDANEAFSLFNASLSAIIQLDAATQAWP